MIQPEQNLLFTDQEKNLTMSRFIKTLKTVVFVVGVDILGFPIYHRHYYVDWKEHFSHSIYFKAFSKN